MVPRIFIIVFTVFLAGCGFVDGNEKMNLIIASKNGDVEKVNYYLKQLKTANYISLKGDTPLNTAISNRHLEVIRVLLESGASCSLKDESGKTPLAVAKIVGDRSILNYLESHGSCT